MHELSPIKSHVVFMSFAQQFLFSRFLVYLTANATLVAFPVSFTIGSNLPSPKPFFPRLIKFLIASLTTFHLGKEKFIGSFTPNNKNLHLCRYKFIRNAEGKKTKESVITKNDFLPPEEQERSNLKKKKNG